MGQKRILGLETEYGLIALGEQKVEAAAKYLFRFRPHGYRGENLFLTNGSRLYLDIGSHPEFASAECSTVPELVAADRAGEELLLKMMTAANQHLQANPNPDGSVNRIHLVKNNEDSAGNTFGCHENYSFPRAVADDVFLPPLTSFLALRICLVGAGGVQRILPEQAAKLGLEPDFLTDEGAYNWCFSVRVPHMMAVTSADPTRERALVNTRDEPHADRERWRRLHVISGDTNRSEGATAMKVALTAGLLEAVEAGVDFSDLLLADPVAAMNDCNWNAHAPVQLVNGQTQPACTVLRGFLERIFANTDLVAADKWAERIRETSLALLEWLENGSGVPEWSPEIPAAQSGVVDWMQKRQLWTGMNRRGDLDLLAFRRFDLAYHDLSPERGLGQRLRQTGMQASWISPEELEWAAEYAPTTTRAAIRGRFLAAVLAKQADFTVSWSQIRLDSPYRQPVDLVDPFQTENAEADELIQFAWEHATEAWIDQTARAGKAARISLSQL